MRLTFLYAPTDDLASAASFYREVLGLREAWREGDDTIAFALADGDTQVMVSTSPQPAGPMYHVDDVTVWLQTHGDIPVAVDRFDIPGGSVIGLADPGGNVFYVFDQVGSPA